MTDIQILEQLKNGNHLGPKELKRAKSILHRLNQMLKNLKFWRKNRLKSKFKLPETMHRYKLL